MMTKKKILVLSISALIILIIFYIGNCFIRISTGLGKAVETTVTEFNKIKQVKNEDSILIVDQLFIDMEKSLDSLQNE